MGSTYDIPNTNFTVTFKDTDINKYKQLLENIDDYKLPKTFLSQRSDLFKYYLCLSSENENDPIYDEDKLDKVDKYLSKVNDIPQIEILYSLLFDDTPCYRSPNDPHEGFVGVFKKSDKWGDEFYNIGMKASDIDKGQLQNLVNYYYKLQRDLKSDVEIEVWGFICYLLYERIHPHHDGNGRIGQLLFVENTHNHVYFPLSEIIAKVKQSQLIQNIYNSVNIPYRHYKNNTCVKYPNTNEYYNLVIDDKLLKNIFKLLCICKEYKILCETFKDVKSKNAIVIKMLRSKLNDDEVENILKNNDELIDLFNESEFDIENHNEVMKL